jgi:excinuclease UvrABC nuclease subunit
MNKDKFAKNKCNIEDSACLKTIPERPGVYKLLNKDGEKKYVGESINLRRRIKEQIRVKKSGISTVSWRTTNLDDRKQIEQELICQFNPPDNIKGKKKCKKN